MFGMTTRWGRLLSIAMRSTLGGAIALSTNSAQAQITPDMTLPNNSSITREGNIHIIEGGTRAGGNLFHSFQQFSVPTGGTAFFNNAADIQNIISRVTGGSVSNIDGLIKANGTANLFLINPNGIVFGKNASLNVGGSFVGTTANAIQFGNLGSFSATNPEAPSPLLTINPSALLFNQIVRSASIQNSSTAPAGLTPSGLNASGLRVPDGKSLLIVGGNISMDGGQLNAYGGRVELGGLAARGNVGLNVDGDKLSLDFPASSTEEDIFLNNKARISVAAGRGGDIAVNARNLEVSGGSVLSAGIGEGLGNAGAKAGDITLNATGDIKIDGSYIVNIVQQQAIGNGGDITLSSNSLSLTNGAQLAASTVAQGDAGNVIINATNSVSLDGGSTIFSSVGSSSDTPEQRNAIKGNGGNIQITTPQLSLTNGAALVAGIEAQGNSGSVIINATNSVSLNGSSAIFSSVGSSSDTPEQRNAIKGNGGNIQITTPQLSLTNGSQLQASTLAQGDAGNVIINATNSVSLDGGYTNSNGQFFPSSIFSTVGSVSDTLEQRNAIKGNGGNIQITTPQFSLTNGAALDATTFGQGNAGNVTVNALDGVSVASNAHIFSTVESGGVGKGGNININAATLSLKDGAELQTLIRSASATLPAGRGDAGNVNVKVTGAVNIAGDKNGFPSGIGSLVQTGTEGNGGNITIDSGSFSLRDGASLEASTLGQGNAGNVTVNALDAVSLAGNAGIFSTVEAGGVGKGGNININAATLSLKDGAELLTLTRRASATLPAGRGDAGNVNVKVTGAVDITGRNSGILSSVQTGTEGKGGNITIDSDSFSLRDGAQLIANTFGQGNAGTIKVNATEDVTISGKSSNFNSGLFVNSQSTTGTAGDIIVTSPRVTQDFSGTLNAQSTLGNGGNINLQSGLLIMRRGAQISTTAGTARVGGDGGNITINAPNGFIVAGAKENNDITANAYTGNGGRVQINASGIYGTQFREKENSQTNDITASSQFGVNGTVTVNTLGIDPTQGLVNLPVILVDTKVAQGCYVGGSQAQSEFIITGRGGLPPNPGEPLTTDAVDVGLVTLKPSSNNRAIQNFTNKTPKPATPQPIVEATGWVIDSFGEVELIANAPTTPHNSWQNPVECRASSVKESSN